MGRSLLNSMPVWVLAPLLIGGFIALAQLVFAAVWRWGDKLRDKEFNTVIGGFVSVVQALFGLTLALVIVSLYQDYRASEAGVRAETTALVEFVRLGSAFPPHVNQQLRDEVTAYVNEVREREWRLLQNGRSSDRAWGDIGSMYATLKDYNPSTASEKAFYSQALSRLNDVVEQRRNSLAAVKGSVPSILGILLLIAASVTVLAPMFLVSISRRFQAAKIVAVSGVVATALFAALVLSSPYSRALPVSKAPFRESELVQLAGP